MTTKKIVIGAPSLSRKDASVQVKEVFSEGDFPRMMTFRNLLPFSVSLPEVRGLFLRHVANAENSAKTLLVSSRTDLIRAAQSAAQIAGLGGHGAALEIASEFEEEAPKPEAKAEAKPAEAGPAKRVYRRKRKSAAESATDPVETKKE